MSQTTWDLRLEVEGVGSWPVLELTQRPPTTHEVPPPIWADADRVELSWREENGVLYMDARPAPSPFFAYQLGGPAEVDLVVAAGVTELAELMNMPSFPFVLRMFDGGELIMVGRAIAAALRCDCPQASVNVLPCHRTELRIVVVG